MQILLKLFPITQTMRTHTGKRQILCCTHLNVAAGATREILTAPRTGLLENHFIPQNGANCVDELVDVIVTFNREAALVTVVIQTQPDQGNEFLFLNPWKLKRFRI
jgi:hypothetical protein